MRCSICHVAQSLQQQLQDTKLAEHEPLASKVSGQAIFHGICPAVDIWLCVRNLEAKLVGKLDAAMPASELLLPAVSLPG